MASVSSAFLVACLLLACSFSQASEYSEHVSKLTHKDGTSIFAATESRFFAFLFPLHEKSENTDIVKTSQVVIDLNNVQKVSGAGSEVYLIDNFKPHEYEEYITQISMDPKNGVRAFSSKDGQTLLKSYKVLQQCVSRDEFETEQDRNGKVKDVATGDSVDLDLIKANLRDFCTLQTLSELIRDDDNVNVFAFQFAPISEKLPEGIATHLKEVYQSEITKFLNEVKSTHSESDIKAVTGEFIRDNLSDLPSSKLQKALESRLLDEVTDDTTKSPIFGVFSVFLIVVVIYTLAGLLNMENDKDSLVYSKFLAPKSGK